MKTEVVSGALGVQYHLVVGQDLIAQVLRSKGVYEPELLMVTAGLLEHVAPQTEEVRGRILDVGANVGTYSLPLAKVYPNLSFECFEPQPSILGLLRQSATLNGFANLAFYECALADADGTVEAILPDYEREPNIGAFSLDQEVQSNEYELGTRGDTVSIPTRTLDSFGFRDVHLIKIDVEGAELSVLRGARQTLARNAFPPILFEAWSWKPWFEPRRKELLQWLAELGYEIQSFGPFSNLAQHHARGAGIQIPGAISLTQ